MSTIRRIEAFPLRLPKTGSDPSTGSASSRYESAPEVRSIYPRRDETLLVRIESDESIGWGEALTPVAPEAPAAIVESLFAPMLIGTPFHGPRPLAFRLQESMRERGHLEGHHADAVAAVDMALWDLWGHELDRPVRDLLGGPHRDRIPLYLTTVPGGNPEEKAASAVEAYGHGFPDMKVHLGMPPAQTLRTVDAMLDALSHVEDPDRPARLAVDAHWVHDRGAARFLARAFDERGIWFFEAPLAPEDLEGHRILAAGAATPVAVGEAMRSRFAFAHWSARGALAVAQPDMGRTGISEGSTIATAVAALHLPIAPHHSMATALAYAAAMHVSAAAEHLLAVEYGPAVLDKSRCLMTSEEMTPGALVRGSVPIGAGPGLGVEVDEQAVRTLAAAFPA